MQIQIGIDERYQVVQHSHRHIPSTRLRLHRDHGLLIHAVEHGAIDQDGGLQGTDECQPDLLGDAAPSLRICLYMVKRPGRLPDTDMVLRHHILEVIADGDAGLLESPIEHQNDLMRPSIATHGLGKLMHITAYATVAISCRLRTLHVDDNTHQ